MAPFIATVTGSEGGGCGRGKEGARSVELVAMAREVGSCPAQGRRPGVTPQDSKIWNVTKIH
jgi:hypothetical protein